MPECEAVFCKDLAGKAEAALFPDLRCIRSSACAEEVVRLVGSQAVFLIIRAYAAILHTDLPVLIGIFNGNRAHFHGVAWYGRG